MAGELRECPLCHSENVACDRDGMEFPVHVVWCKDCGCTVDDDSAHKSDLLPFDRWNTRPLASARNEALEEAARLIDAHSEGSDGAVDGPVLFPRMNGDRSAFAYAAAIRALKSTPAEPDYCGIVQMEPDHGGRGDTGEGR
jgi:hypothetical protein